jgi:hypothetical protein
MSGIDGGCERARLGIRAWMHDIERQSRHGTNSTAGQRYHYSLARSAPSDARQETAHPLGAAHCGLASAYSRRWLALLLEHSCRLDTSSQLTPGLE